MVATLVSPAELTAASRLTVEEYAQLGGDVPTELIDGEVVEMTRPGAMHSELQALLAGLLNVFVRPKRLGKVYTEGGFVLSRDPNIVRGPDVAFVVASRVPQKSPSGFIEGAPDLAVEINSPNDRWSAVEDKVRLYLASGSRVVWVVDEPTQTVTVRQADGTTRVYGRDETLTGGEILPGFELPLAELFE